MMSAKQHWMNCFHSSDLILMVCSKPWMATRSSSASSIPRCMNSSASEEDLLEEVITMRVKGETKGLAEERKTLLEIMSTEPCTKATR